MKKIHVFIVTITTIFLCALSACSSQNDMAMNKDNKKDEIVVNAVPSKGMVLIGTKEQTEKTREGMEELIDPADDIAIHSWELYKQKKYGEAEKEALRAISLAKHGIVKHTAHNTLLNIYEATNNYDAAIEEIDWLIKNVNEQARIELMEKKRGFEQLLNEGSKKNMGPS